MSASYNHPFFLSRVLKDSCMARREAFGVMSVVFVESGRYICVDNLSAAVRRPRRYAAPNERHGVLRTHASNA